LRSVMANKNPKKENLIPIRTKIEARKKGQIGGKKSGRARNEKKIMLSALLHRIKSKDLDEMADGLISRAKTTDSAYALFRDTVGEKPVDKIDFPGISDSERAAVQEIIKQYAR
jgi:hypothetical protein